MQTPDPNKVTSFRPARRIADTEYTEAYGRGANEDLQYSEKKVYRMEHSGRNTEGEDIVKRFMSQYADDTRPKKLTKQMDRRDEYDFAAGRANNNFAPAGGKMTATGIQVDAINQRFKSGDPYHLLKLKPPATSTPTTEELAEAWGAVDQIEDAQEELFSDPLVKFLMLVDGFCDSNGISKSTRHDKGITLPNVYHMLANDRSSRHNNTPNRTPYARSLPLQSGTAGLNNTITRRYGATSRVTDNSIEDEVMQGVRDTNVGTRMSSIRFAASNPRVLYNTPGTPFPYRYTGTPGTPGINYPDYSTPSGGRHVNFVEPSGPKRTPPTTPISPLGITPANTPPSPTVPKHTVIGQLDPQVLDISPLLSDAPIPTSDARGDEGEAEEEGEDEEAQRRVTEDLRYRTPPSNTALERDRDLVRIAEDPRNTRAATRYLSDLRTADAYNYINTPEVTGRFSIQPAVYAAIEMALTALQDRFPDNYEGTEIMDFVNSNLCTNFAYYVALWKLYNISKAMNKVTLEKQQPRLLSELISMENGIFSRYRFDWYTKSFVRERARSRKITRGRNATSGQSFQSFYMSANEMFHY